MKLLKLQGFLVRVRRFTQAQCCACRAAAPHSVALLHSLFKHPPDVFINGYALACSNRFIHTNKNVTGKIQSHFLVRVRRFTQAQCCACRAAAPHSVALLHSLFKHPPDVFINGYALACSNRFIHTNKNVTGKIQSHFLVRVRRFEHPTC